MNYTVCLSCNTEVTYHSTKICSRCRVAAKVAAAEHRARELTVERDALAERVATLEHVIILLGQTIPEKVNDF